MPIHSRKNQYLGVNAHLHSILQNEGGDWRSFHADHITHLRDLIEPLLPEGYYAQTERSLQIQRDPLISEAGRSTPTVPDVLISREEPRQPRPAPVVESAPTLVFSVVETLRDEQDFLDALVIYRATHAGRIGEPVTRIELLSPGNKPPHTACYRYLDQREETLRSGVALIEIDYLHQQRSPIARLPSYPDREPGAYPYSIVVSDPHPSLETGPTKVYGFRVDDPIPAVSLPIGEDRLLFDFGRAYNFTYAAARYRQRVVDYAQEPERFETYDAEDRQRIRRRMAAVQRAVAQGLDLEQGPFPVD